MVDDLSQRLVPDGLWALVEPLLPKFEARPQVAAQRQSMSGPCSPQWCSC
ncbi:hypothetical protein [Nocardia sp. NBC_00565]